MAKQSSMIKFDGRMDEVSFFEGKDGHLARYKKGKIPKELATGIQYARTRENILEFGRLGKSCKLVRELARPYGKKATDHRMFGRLMREMRKVFNSDSTSDRGLRNAVDGDVGLLNGFDFNINAPLRSIITEPFTATIDRTSGKAQVDFSAFLPENGIHEPKSATHFQLKVVAAELDFVNESFKIDSKMSEELPLTTENPGIQLACQLPADSTHP